MLLRHAVDVGHAGVVEQLAVGVVAGAAARAVEVTQAVVRLEYPRQLPVQREVVVPVRGEDDDLPGVPPPPDPLPAHHHLHQGVQGTLGVVDVAGHGAVQHRAGELGGREVAQHRAVVEAVGRRAVPRLRRAVEGGDGAGEGLHVLLHEAAEPRGEVLCLPLDRIDDIAAQLGEVLPGVPHGPGQVHQEVEVNGELLCVRNLELQRHGPAGPQLRGHPLRRDLDILAAGARVRGHGPRLQRVHAAGHVYDRVSGARVPRRDPWHALGGEGGVGAPDAGGLGHAACTAGLGAAVCGGVWRHQGEGEGECGEEHGATVVTLQQHTGHTAELATYTATTLLLAAPPLSAATNCQYLL